MCRELKIALGASRLVNTWRPGHRRAPGESLEPLPMSPPVLLPWCFVSLPLRVHSQPVHKLTFPQKLLFLERAQPPCVQLSSEPHRGGPTTRKPMGPPDQPASGSYHCQRPLRKALACDAVAQARHCEFPPIPPAVIWQRWDPRSTQPQAETLDCPSCPAASAALPVPAEVLRSDKKKKKIAFTRWVFIHTRKWQPHLLRILWLPKWCGKGDAGSARCIPTDLNSMKQWSPELPRLRRKNYLTLGS